MESIRALLLKVRVRSASGPTAGVQAPGTAPPAVAAVDRAGPERVPAQPPPDSPGNGPGLVGSMQDVSATVLVQERSGSLPPGTDEPGRAPTTENAPMARAIAADIAQLAQTTAKGLNRWPGVVLTLIGIVVLLVTWAMEFAEPAVFGVAEYVASIVVGLCLAVAGGSLISVDLNRITVVVEAARKAKEWDDEHRAEVTGERNRALT